ncbi:hypothetical protein CDAR_517701 [Caerostris darwini]|uniref:Uncharacterized protein n=1 Tax=Caerostris darwini TaxID=1538125 RepID=A0AAV4SFV5_9ARAC|nr:hypothetical protein CDAR_517701 [Caerostris darwini]
MQPISEVLDGVLGRNGINNGYQNVVVRTDRCDKSAGNQAISSLPIHDGAIVNKKGCIWPCSNELGSNRTFSSNLNYSRMKGVFHGIPIP